MCLIIFCPILFLFNHMFPHQTHSSFQGEERFALKLSRHKDDESRGSDMFVLLECFLNGNIECSSVQIKYDYCIHKTTLYFIQILHVLIYNLKNI